MLGVSALRSAAVRRWWGGDGLPTGVHVLAGLILPMFLLIANMWEVHRFTVDDAYISFRYARNLADGLGLVYNAGEKIEGYTNFAWTLLLAGGIELGIDPHVTSKVVGGAAACGTLVVVYLLSQRLFGYGVLPCVATWLLASSAPFSGYAVFGLETSAFAFLVVTGVWTTIREEDRAARIPWSGLVFGLAGITRPEAPLFAGLALLIAGKKVFAPRNILRGLLFALPVLGHVLWRYSYYGRWLPATLVAKTGDMRQQFEGGLHYLTTYAEHATAVVFMACFAIALGIVRKRVELLAVSGTVVAWAAYVLLEGGDWMPFFRFMAPIEPFLFILVGMSVRAIAHYRDRAANIALLLFGAYVVWARHEHLQQAHHKFMVEERTFWRNAAGQTADWLVTHGQPGLVAIGDIGYVGYRTNYPILDLLGLVDPVIARLPGGYTKKLGRGFVDRVYGARPEYIVIVVGGQSCDNPVMAGSRLIYHDPRFRAYEVAHNVQVNPAASWCIYRRKHG